MARYGLDYYGLGKYGSESSAYIEFDASPFVANATGTKQITLEWTSPSGDWARIKLVRNTYGFPLNVDDGTLVYEATKGTDIGYFIDTGAIPNNVGLKAGIPYHYSLFVLETQASVWTKAGNAVGISIKDFNAFEQMYSALPAIYKSTTLKTITDYSDNPDLEAFLRIFGTTLDLYKTHAQLVLETYDTSKAYAPIIPVMMQQFGLTYEPELGLQQSRIFLRNATYLNGRKASYDGVKDFVRAFTGYDAIVSASKNIMLDYNDSSFEQSVGRWASIANCSLEKVTSSTVVPYSEPSLSSNYPNKATGSLQVNTTSGGDAELACGLSAPKTRGIPVQAGFVYTFSIYTQTYASNKRRQVHVDIRWFNRKGVEISRAGEVSILNPFGSWGRVSVTDTAPDECYFAIPTIRIEGSGNNEHHWFDAAQFEQSAEGATAFEEAREVKVTLVASRVNQSKNPSFEVNTDYWSCTNGTISRDIAHADEDRGSDVSLLIQSTVDNNEVTLQYTDFIKILGGYWYTANGYVRTAFTGEKSEDYLGGWGIKWYDANQTFISESKSTDQNLTEFYSASSYYRTDNVLTVFTEEITSAEIGQSIRLLDFPDSSLNGDYVVTAVSGNYIQMSSAGSNIALTQIIVPAYVQDLKLDFVRITHEALAPATARYAKPFFFWSNALSTQNLRLDTTMFEQSSVAKPYFDGSTGFTTTSDLMWEGTTHGSRSHYYKNRVATQVRLDDQLPDYLIHGTPFTLFLAQPAE